MSVINQLDSMILSQGDTSAEIAQFIIANKERIGCMQMKEISSAMDVSMSTLSRFFNKLGYIGFSDFKLELIKELSETEPQNYEMIDNLVNNDNLLDMADELILAVDSAARRARKCLPINEINRSCNLLVKARVIGLYVLNQDMLSFREKYKRVMMDIGLQVIAPEDNYDVAACTLVLNSSDSVVIIGDKESIVQNKEWLFHLVQNGVKLIVLSDQSVQEDLDISMIEMIIPDAYGVDTPERKYMTTVCFTYYLDVLLSYAHAIRLKS